MLMPWARPSLGLAKKRTATAQWSRKGFSEAYSQNLTAKLWPPILKAVREDALKGVGLLYIFKFESVGGFYGQHK